MRTSGAASGIRMLSEHRGSDGPVYDKRCPPPKRGGRLCIRVTGHVSGRPGFGFYRNLVHLYACLLYTSVRHDAGNRRDSRRIAGIPDLPDRQPGCGYPRLGLFMEKKEQRIERNHAQPPK